MKLNEGRLIAQILKLANQIKNADDVSEVKSCADGIISICNIIDIETVVAPFGSPPINNPSEIMSQKVDNQEMFKTAKEEQQSGDANLERSDSRT